MNRNARAGLACTEEAFSGSTFCLDTKCYLANQDVLVGWRMQENKM